MKLTVFRVKWGKKIELNDKISTILNKSLAKKYVMSYSGDPHIRNILGLLPSLMILDIVCYTQILSYRAY